MKAKLHHFTVSLFILFIYFIVSNVRMVMNYDRKEYGRYRLWPSFRVLARYLFASTRRNTDIFDQVNRYRAEIRTENLSNTSQKHYH